MWDDSEKVKMACGAPTHGRKYEDSWTFASTLLVSVFSQEVEPSAEVWSYSDTTTSSMFCSHLAQSRRSRSPQDFPFLPKHTGRRMVELDWCTGTTVRFSLNFPDFLKVSRHFASCKYFCSGRNHFKSCSRIVFIPSGQNESGNLRNVV